MFVVFYFTCSLFVLFLITCTYRRIECQVVFGLVQCVRWNERQCHYMHVNWDSSRYILIGNPFSSRLTSIHTAELPNERRDLFLCVCVSVSVRDLPKVSAIFFHIPSYHSQIRMHTIGIIVFVLIESSVSSFKCLYLHMKLGITLHLFYSLLIGILIQFQCEHRSRCCQCLWCVFVYLHILFI